MFLLTFETTTQYRQCEGDTAGISNHYIEERWSLAMIQPQYSGWQTFTKHGNVLQIADDVQHLTNLLFFFAIYDSNQVMIMKQWQRRDYNCRTIYVYYNQATFTQRRACNLTLTLDSWLIKLSTIPFVTRYTITWTILWAASSFSLSILQRVLTCWRTSPKSDRYLINPAERPSVSLPSRQRWHRVW